MGVGFDKKSGLWVARITIDGKPVHLGSFSNKDDAISARKDAEVKSGFHKNHGRSTGEAELDRQYNAFMKGLVAEIKDGVPF
jgi:hypothetical protein